MMNIGEPYDSFNDVHMYISQNLSQRSDFVQLNHFKIQIWHLRESIQSLMQLEQSEVIRIRRGLTNCFCPQANTYKLNSEHS